ncbi:hypothetical protein DV515_00011380, partial [Chloebia gouldiae]
GNQNRSVRIPISPTRMVKMIKDNLTDFLILAILTWKNPIRTLSFVHLFPPQLVMHAEPSGHSVGERRVWLSAASSSTTERGPFPYGQTAGAHVFKIEVLVSGRKHFVEKRYSLSGSGVWAQSATLTDAACLHGRKASSANKRSAWVFTALVSAMLEEFSFSSMFAGGSPELAQERSINLRMILQGLYVSDTSSLCSY